MAWLRGVRHGDTSGPAQRGIMDFRCGGSAAGAERTVQTVTLLPMQAGLFCCFDPPRWRKNMCIRAVSIYFALSDFFKQTRVHTLLLGKRLLKRSAYCGQLKVSGGEGQGKALRSITYCPPRPLPINVPAFLDDRLCICVADVAMRPFSSFPPFPSKVL